MSTPNDAGDALGASYDGGGVSFAVAAPGAEAVELCLVSAGDRREERRILLSARGGGIFRGRVHGLAPGALYAYRVHGPYAPREGARFNPAKRLVDPYAQAIAGDFAWHADQSGFLRAEGPDSARPDPVDSAHSVPPAVVVDERYDWGDDVALRTPLSDSLIYECHVKGLTISHPEIDARLRGRYLGLCSEPMIEHLHRLGVTAVELLPVQHKLDERHLVERGLTNYWGYNPIGWMAPDSRFASASDGAQVRELKTAIRRLHQAGIEVILDVVFNHSGEGDHTGPTVSLKGFGNAVFYDLEPGRPERYRDFSGCGAGLNLAHPAVRRLVLDSLRRWVREYHVDGFRFDLAAALVRENGEMDFDLGILREIAEDPSLAGVKLIAEPWDAKGTSILGRTREPWSEWNGEYRDSVRRAWRAQREARGLAGRLATAIAGSSDAYAARRPSASVNFVACHDGPTLADLTSYGVKHNEVNGEGNRDGPAESFASNWGVEGETAEPAVLAARHLARRNLLATLAFSLGVPMLQHGDEMGRTQKGLDNGYCQDGPRTWMDWRLTEGDRELLTFAREAFSLRRSLGVFQRTSHFTGVPDGAGVRDLVWLDSRGHELSREDWGDALALAALYDTRAGGDGCLALLVNLSDAPLAFVLPPRCWEIRLVTAKGASSGAVVERELVVAARSLALLVGRDVGEGESA